MQLHLLRRRSAQICTVRSPEHACPAHATQVRRPLKYFDPRIAPKGTTNIVNRHIVPAKPRVLENLDHKKDVEKVEDAADNLCPTSADAPAEFSGEYSSQGSVEKYADAEGRTVKPSRACDDACDEHCGYSYEEEEVDEEEDVKVDASDRAAEDEEEYSDESGSDDGGEEVAGSEEDGEDEYDEYDEYSDEHSSQGSADVEGSEEKRQEDCSGSGSEYSYEEEEEEEDDVSEADVPPDAGKAGHVHNKECDDAQEVGNADDIEIAIHELENDTAGGSKQDKAVDEAADAGEAACVDGDAGEHVPEAEDEAADDAAGADRSESGALKDDSQIPFHEAEDADPEGDTPGGAKQGKAVDEAADVGEAACVNGDAGEHVPDAEDEAADDAAEADQSGSGVLKDDSQIPLHEAEDADPEGDTPGGAKQGKAVDEAADVGEAARVDGDAGEHVPDAEDEAADDAAEADQSGSGALEDDTLHEAEDADPEGDTPGGAKQGKAVDEAADVGEAACVDGDAGEHVPDAEDEAADDAAEADQCGLGALKDDSQIPLHEAEDADPEGDTPGGAKQGKAVDEAADVGEAACVDGDAGEHVPDAEDEAADDAAEADQSGSGALKDDSPIPLHEAEDADPEGDTPGGAKQGKAGDEAADVGEAACVDGDAGEHVPDAEDEAADDAAEADQSGSGVLKDDSQIPLHEAEDADPEGETPGRAKQGKAVDEAADDGDAGENVPEAEDESADDASEADESSSGVWEEDGDVTLHAGGSKEDQALDEAGDAGGLPVPTVIPERTSLKPR